MIYNSQSSISVIVDTDLSMMQLNPSENQADERIYLDGQAKQVTSNSKFKTNVNINDQVVAAYNSEAERRSRNYQD